MLKRIMAPMMALAMIISAGLALAEAPAASEDRVLATIGGQPIYQAEADAIMPSLANYMSDPTDYRYAVQFLVQQRVLNQKIKDMGFDQFSPEEEAAFASEAQSQWDEGVESYVSYYLAEDTEEARAQMKQKAEEFYANEGFSLEVLAENLRQRAAIDRMSDYLVGEYEPSEEEIQATFQQYGAQYQQAYENDVMAYEYNTVYNQQPSWYVPEGYRGIIHILLKPDQAALEEYDRLRLAFEEQQNEADSEPADEVAVEGEEAPAQVAETSPEPTTQPVTQAQVDAARQAVYASRQADIDDIYARLDKGEAFQDLIKAYGEDPGMTDEQALADGYSVHKESMVWDPAFIEAAFSDKMQKVGDWSEPVIGTYGVHILYYLRDLPSGLIMTEDIRQELVEFLKTVRESEAFNTAYSQWEQESNVVFNDEAIQAATDSAKATEPGPEAPELEGLVALPEGQEDGNQSVEETPEATAAPAGN